MPRNKNKYPRLTEREAEVMEQQWELDPEKIQSITVRKDDPAHPDGVIEITMK